MLAVMMDDGDDLLVRRRREIPPFPWGNLRRILVVNGDGYSPCTRPNPVPITTRNLSGVRWQAMERADLDAPRVMAAIQRAFNESRKRHGLHETHWRILLALEVGMVYRRDGRGMERLVIYRPERPDAVVPDDEAARIFGVAASTVRVYHSQVRRAVEDEWQWLCSGYEG